MNKNLANEKILDKIRKLLKLGNDERGNPEESKAALAKAQELLTAHGIEMASINLDDPKAHSWKIESDALDTGRRWFIQDEAVLKIMKSVFGVKTYRSWSPKGYNPGFIGERLDIELCKMSYNFFYREMTSGFNQWLKTHGRKWNAADSRGFCFGLADGFINASDSAKQYTRAKAKRADADAFAIVLVDKDNAICMYAEKEMNLRPGRKSAAKMVGNSAFTSGHLRGSTLSIPQAKLA